MTEIRKFIVDSSVRSQGLTIIPTQVPIIPTPPTVTPSPSVPPPTPTPSPTPGTPAPTPTPTPPSPTPTPVPVPPTPTPTPDPTLRYDDFLRADGPLGTTPTGNIWQINSGTWAILSHQARLVTSSGTGTNFCFFPGSANSDIQVTMPVVDDGVGIVFRYQNATNYWKFTSATAFNTYTLFKVVNGAQSWVGDVGPIGVTNGDLLRVSCQDANITISVNGTHTVTKVDAALSTVGNQAGLFSANSTTARFSLIQIFTRADTVSPSPTPTPTPVPPSPTPTPTPTPGNLRYPSHASTDTGAIVANITNTITGNYVPTGSAAITLTNTKILGAIDARGHTGNLILNNVWVEYGHGTASYCIRGGSGTINATNLTVSRWASANLATLASEDTHGIIGFNGGTINNYNFSGMATGVDPGNGTWNFNYGDIHNLGKLPGSRTEGAHTECVFIGLSGNGTYNFSRTRFDHRNESGSWSTGGIFTEEWHGTCGGVTFDNCMFESMGAYSLYGTRSNGPGGTESPTAANCPISVSHCDFQYMAVGTPRPWGSYYRFWFNSVPVWTDNWECDGNDVRTRVINLPSQAVAGGSDVNSQQVINEQLWTPGVIVPTPTPTPPSPTPTPTPTPVAGWWAVNTHTGGVLSPPTGPKQSLTSTVASMTVTSNVSRVRCTGKATVIGGPWTISDCWIGEIDNSSGSGTIINDSKIDNGGSNAGVYYNNYTLNRCEVTTCFDGLKGLGTTTVDNCWVHLLNNQHFADGTYTHNDGLQMSSGSNLRITNSRFEDTGINSAVFIDPDQGVINGVVIDSCYLQGGIWALFVVNSASNPGTGNPLNMTFSNLIFGAPATTAASYAGYCNVANQTGVPIACTWINNKNEYGIAVGQVSKDTPMADRWRTKQGINP